MSDWAEAERHAERAQQFYEAGQWQQALHELRQALKLNPYQSDWHFGLGLALEAVGRYDEAAGAFEQVLHLRGDEDIETMLRLGVDLIRADRSQRALEVLERAAELEPDCEPAYCHRILAYTQLGDHESAELMFYMARQLVEECPACYDRIAHSMAVRGQFERAIWCWQQSLRLDPQYPDAHANLGLAHWRLGQRERAREDFLRQLREAPGDVSTLLDLGNLLTELGRPEEASEKFRRALETDPHLADGHFYLGELALSQNRLEEAAERFERARHLNPDRPGIQLGLAQVARRKGRLKEARDRVRAEATRAGQTPAQLLELADQLLDLGMSEEVEEVLTPVLSGESEPGLETQAQAADALLYRGVARLRRRQMGSGIADLRLASRYAPGEPRVLEQLVRAHLKAGRLARARVWLRRYRRAVRGESGRLARLSWRVYRDWVRAIWRRQWNSTHVRLMRAGARWRGAGFPRL